jgi:hypothetical protein
MKHSLKYFCGALMVAAMSTLIACGSSGGSSSSSPASVGIAGYNATPGNVGQGTWTGVLQGNGSQQFLAMMSQLGNAYSQNLDLQLTTYNGGILPGQVGVTMGYNTQFYAQAYVSGNAFSANYTPGQSQVGGYGGVYGGGYNGAQCVPGYACNTAVNNPALQTGTPLISINTQFVDPCTRQILSVQFFYQGALVAQGQLTSSSPIQTTVYNPACPNQPVYGGTGYNGGTGYYGGTPGYYGGNTYNPYVSQGYRNSYSH